MLIVFCKNILKIVLSFVVGEWVRVSIPCETNFKLYSCICFWTEGVFVIQRKRGVEIWLEGGYYPFSSIHVVRNSDGWIVTYCVHVSVVIYQLSCSVPTILNFCFGFILDFSSGNSKSQCLASEDGSEEHQGFLCTKFCKPSASRERIRTCDDATLQLAGARCLTGLLGRQWRVA